VPKPPPLTPCPRCEKRPRKRAGDLCTPCRAAADSARHKADRVRREASDFEPLAFGDFEGGAGRDKDADREKKQEYSRRMGRFAEMLAAPGSVAEEEQQQVAAYVSRLAEEERRFGNRRLARSVSLAAAHETLARRQFLQAAGAHLTGKVAPAGFALRAPAAKPASRSVCVLLSDLHIGAEMGGRDNPEAFGAVQESRRLGKLAYEVAEFKPQYRDASELVVLFDGDNIEGDLLHDRRAGAPLTEQKIAFLHYFRSVLGFWARVYKSVRVVATPGNHGRDKLRHPGRATESKWDGVEWELYRCLEMMCSNLRNVTWDIPFRAVAIVDVQGAKVLLAHGDTEPKMKHPDSGSAENLRTMHKVNSTRIYGCQFDLACFGHFHSPRYQPKRPTRMLFNGMLVPPNGHARSEGYIDEPCGQWVWEAVEGHPVGDLRFVTVGPSEDADARLSAIAPPFRFPSAA
jgi:predicted phosphodiesterase